MKDCIGMDGRPEPVTVESLAKGAGLLEEMFPRKKKLAELRMTQHTWDFIRSRIPGTTSIAASSGMWRVRVSPLMEPGIVVFLNPDGEVIRVVKVY